MKGLALLVIFAFGLLVWSANQGAIPYPLARVSAFPGGDKLGHFLITAALTYLVNQAFSCRVICFKSSRFLLGSVLIFLIITIEEVSQVFVTTREFSLLDLGSDYLGIALAGWALNKR
jgi:VanZ family protein